MSLLRSGSIKQHKSQTFIYSLLVCVTGQHPATDLPTLLISGIDVNGTSMIIRQDGYPIQWMHDYRNGIPITFPTGIITGTDPKSTAFRYHINHSVHFSPVFFHFSTHLAFYTCCFTSKNLNNVTTSRLTMNLKWFLQILIKPYRCLFSLYFMSVKRPACHLNIWISSVL